ncbi:efflux RND transporter periplasmic adaptor subunit [Sphingobium lignivorans]|uniref:Membrane fusion protein (Multidrug efflux system) n=1 Tax=Sphingobium lignivorans TaxID=2735886 RepID=A0ABR6NI38_9SPHN|nr:efflux RND transporter periplasmic adaptor subunit [Sphingobium lignivorans]MBB5986953.1 membrane fusion protein (multidrug efflux system) [Sphingobium lignivorans]
MHAKRAPGPALLLVAVVALLAACSGGEQQEQRREPPLVTAVEPQPHLFRDEIQAVGSARANEQVTLAANVTERIERLLFDDGMYVRAGQLLAVLSSAQEEAALAGARASAAEAQAQLERVNSLNEQGFATGALLDRQRAALSEAKAAQESIQAQISDRMIRAPFSGYLSLRNVSAGAIVTTGTPLVTVSDISRIKLDFTVPETQLALLRPGQPIKAFASAYPDDPIIGQVSVIDPVIDPQSRAVMVRATLPNPGNRIKPGMLLTVRIETGQRTALAVPEMAVMAEGDLRYVYTVDDKHVVRRTAVTTGLRDGGFIEVAGLPRDARVVAEGVVKVAEGRPVRLTEGPGRASNENPASGPQEPAS